MTPAGFPFRFCPKCLRNRRSINVTFRTKMLFLKFGHEMLVCSRCGNVLTPKYHLTPRDERQANQLQQFKERLALKAEQVAEP